MNEQTSPRPSRGFITVATGKEKYYWLAWHLLHSYRFHTGEPLPFAILCDKENRYTKDFDQVILLKEAIGSYNDKLRLPDYVPYAETIFVDADTLAYGDLNVLFDVFAEAPDFSALGQTLPFDAEICWFHPEDTGIWRDRLHFCNWFQGGIYYLRSSDTMSRLSSLCRKIYDTYGDYRFWNFTAPADEPVYALAMSVLDLPTVHDRPEYNCFYPDASSIRCDIRTGLLEYTSRWDPQSTLIHHALRVHWGARYTRSFLYQREAFRLRCRVRKGHLLAFSYLLRKAGPYTAGKIRHFFRPHD